MRITLLIGLFLGLSLTLNAQKNIKLEVNSKLPAKYVKRSKGMTSTAASQLFPFIEIKIKKVEYLIAFDDESREIKYIYTDDEDFTDSNGLKVDQEIRVKWEDIEVLPNFQLRTKPDKNGWQAIIGNSSSFNGDFLERIQKAGQLTTEIDGFAKGYNY